MRNAGHNGPAPELLCGDLDSPAHSTTAALPATPRTPARGRATLPEPVKVAEFWKNRRGESIRVTLETYEGRNLVDVRQCRTGDDGKMLMTKRGISLSVLRLPELARAINKALQKAIELGLVDAGGSL
jgi:hypothetical protein